jgi:hypothetical protein
MPTAVDKWGKLVVEILEVFVTELELVRIATHREPHGLGGFGVVIV